MATTLQFGLRSPSIVPEFLERGKANEIRLAVWSNGAEVYPSTGTISIYDPTGAVVVNAAALTIPTTLGVPTATARYTWTPPTSTTLGENWRIEWTATFVGTIADDVDPTYTFQRSAMIVRHRLVCAVSMLSLWIESPGLNPTGTAPITTLTAAEQDQMLEVAWARVETRLLAQGRRPYLVMDASALNEVTTYTALAIIFGSLAHRLNENYQALADKYEAKAEAAWLRLRLTYDETDDSVADQGKKAAGTAVLWFGRGVSNPWPGRGW